jgi:PAS domain S-box-containing protein
VNEDASSQLKSEPTTLPGDFSAKTKSRVANLLHAVLPKRRTESDKQPNGAPNFTSNSKQGGNSPIPEEPVRPVIGADKAALFLNSAGNIVAVQPRCAEFFGRQPEELTGQHFKALLKPGFDQEITKVLTKRGPRESEHLFCVSALRKDGSEFATQFAFKFLPNNHGFCWTVLVQAPGSSDSGINQNTMDTQSDSHSTLATESAAPTATGNAGHAQSVGLENAHSGGGQQWRRLQAEYATRIAQLEQDLEGQWQTNQELTRKLEAQEKSLNDLSKGMRRMKGQSSEPAATLEKAEAGSNDLQQRLQAVEAEATGLRKERDQLRSNLLALRKTEQQAQTQAPELAAQLERSSAELQDLRKRAEEAETARKQLTTELAKERDANKLSGQKTEELNAEVKKLREAADQAESRIRESAAHSTDWEKKAAELKKTVDDLTRGRTTEQSVATQSAQRVKEFEQQLKRAEADLAAAKVEVEKQNSARQKLEAENRNLTEAIDKAKADLAKEREAFKLSGQKAEELNTQVQKLKRAAEQSAAATQSAQRVKELEQQLKGATADLTASHTEVEKQNAALQKLEAQNRNLTEATAKAKADLAESVKNQAAAEKRASELEQRVREGVSSLAKRTAELQKERAELDRAEKCTTSAAAHLQQLTEKLNRQSESERSRRDEIANLEKTIHDRGDALARASAALRKETKERHMAEKQLRLVSEIGARLESNLASLDEAKKAFEVSTSDKDERLQVAERSLAKANSSLEKHSAERRRTQELLAETQRQLEKLSGESKIEISKLRAGLELGELQRKRMEGDLLRAREIATNAQRGQNVTLESLRVELRQPVEDLRQSACHLLEGQITDEQKRTAESMLEKALFLQLTLNATAKTDSPDKKSEPK